MNRFGELLAKRFDGVARVLLLIAVMVAVSSGAIAGEDAGAKIPPATADSAARPNSAEADARNYTTESLQGKVFWLADVLKRRFGIETDHDAHEAMVALESPDGRVFPIAKDARGRAFHLDPRLRGVEMELLVRRYKKSPVVQVIRIYTLKPSGKYELDYWCDVCGIPMYELKPCECCQGETRIRERPVVDGVTLPEDSSTE